MSDDYIHPLSINGQLMKKDARIAELEADNKKLRELGWVAILGLPDELKEYLRKKARAALNGEKRCCSIKNF